MDTSLCYPDFHPVTENIMSVMQELKEKNITDKTLFSNLDFAERFFRDHPLKQYSKLVVKGGYSCVQIGQNVRLVFIITSENNQTYVNVCVSDYGQNITSIDSRYFFNHSCQDEFKSCFTQAQETVSKGNLTRLNVKCNRFSVMYKTQFNGLCATVETKCELKLENITVAGLLNKKVWLQKEKSACPGLIACLDHLIKQVLTTSGAIQHYCRFIMHADKEIITITITSGQNLTLTETECVLIHDNEGVSMFPPALK